MIDEISRIISRLNIPQDVKMKGLELRTLLYENDTVEEVKRNARKFILENFNKWKEPCLTRNEKTKPKKKKKEENIQCHEIEEVEEEKISQVEEEKTITIDDLAKELSKYSYKEITNEIFKNYYK